MTRDDIRQEAIRICERHSSVNMFYMLNRMVVPNEEEELTKMYRMAIKEMVTSVLADMYWITTTYPDYHCAQHVDDMATFFLTKLKYFNK